VSTIRPVHPEIDFALLPLAGCEIPDFHELMAELRQNRPVAPVRFHGGVAFVITRHADVVEAFCEEEIFSPRATQEANTFPVMGRNLMGMEGEEHRVKRALVSPAFRRKLMPNAMEQLLRPLCHRLVDGFADRGTADLVAEFNRQLPLTVIARMLGIPADDEADLKRWALALISYPWDPEGALAASAEFTAYLAPLLTARRREPGDDLISTLVCAEVEGERLSDEEIYAFLRLLFPAGADTTYLALGSLVHGLLTHPDAMERVLADPKDRPAAVDEAVRWECPTSLLPRLCPVDAEFRGEKIPAGSPVLLGISPANRDPAVFDDPDRFDIARDTRAHVGFGHGRHFCLGSHLARAEMTAALDVLLERLPNLRLAGETRMLGAILRGPDALPVAFDT
jgi:cytochrome P450